MSIQNDKISRMMAPAIVAAATLMAAAGTASLIASIARIGPGVGDIIAFESSHDAPANYDVKLLVSQVQRSNCVLDLDTILHHGGSLVLEARLPGKSRAFYLHWAGEMTSSDENDCGTTADLVVDRRDIDILAVAAGGYGVGGKTSPLITGSVHF